MTALNKNESAQFGSEFTWIVSHLLDQIVRHCGSQGGVSPERAPTRNHPAFNGSGDRLGQTKRNSLPDWSVVSHNQTSCLKESA